MHICILSVRDGYFGKSKVLQEQHSDQRHQAIVEWRGGSARRLSQRAETQRKLGAWSEAETAAYIAGLAASTFIPRIEEQGV